MKKLTYSQPQCRAILLLASRKFLNESDIYGYEGAAGNYNSDQDNDYGDF